MQVYTQVIVILVISISYIVQSTGEKLNIITELLRKEDMEFLKNKKEIYTQLVIKYKITQRLCDIFSKRVYFYMIK